MSVFVDTSAIYALLDHDDAGHMRARRGQELVGGEELLTHSYVVAETMAVVRRRLGADAAARLVDDFLPALRVVDVDEDLRNTATRAYRAAEHTDVSFVDRTSFECMRRLDLTRAWTLDTDFSTAGFTVVG